MKIFAVNGSPRTKNNTTALLKECLKGVASVSPKAETEILNLYKMEYSGCISCFACKKLNGRSYGRCNVKDELQGVLRSLAQADGIIFGSPVYFAGITGAMRSFLERLLFQYTSMMRYAAPWLPKRCPPRLFTPWGRQKKP